MGIVVVLPDGREVEVDTENPEEASRAARRYYADSAPRQWRQTAPGRWESEPAAEPGRTPGYTKARRRYEALDDQFSRQGLTGGFTDQVVRNLGVSDEISAIAAYLGQGATNAISRIQGKPVEVSAVEAAQAAADVDNASRAAYAQRHPGLDAGASAAGIALSGRPALAAAPASSSRLAVATTPSIANPLVTGTKLAAVNVPFALARQEGDLQDRVAPAAVESAVTLALGAGGQQLSNTLASRIPPQAARAQAFENAGVRPTFAAVSGGGSATMTKAVGENPIAGVMVRSRLQESLDDTRDAAMRIADEIGTPAPTPIIGERIQKGVEAFAREGGGASRNVGTVTLNRQASAARSTPTRTMGFAGKSEALYNQALGRLANVEKARIERPTARQIAMSQVDEMDAAAHRAAVAVLEREGLAPSGAGALTGARARDVLARSIAANPERTADALRRANQPLPSPAYRVSTGSTLGALRSIQGRVGAPNVAQVVNDPLIARIANAVEADVDRLRIGDLRQLRTWVREAQRNPQLRQGMDDAALQRLESALTEDIMATAYKLGGRDGVQDLVRADQYYRAGMERIKNALQPFADARSGEGAYQRVINAARAGSTGDVKKLLSLKRSLDPGDWNDLSATIVANLGAPTRGSANALEDGAFSINTFVTNYAGLSQRGRQILFGDLGGGGAEAARLMDELDNLARVAGMQKVVEQAANLSNTSVAGQSVGLLAGLVNYPLQTIGTVGGLVAVGELLTNPRFVRWLASAPEAGQTLGGARRHIALLGRMAAGNPALQAYYGEVVAATADAMNGPEAATDSDD